MRNSSLLNFNVQSERAPGPVRIFCPGFKVHHNFKLALGDWLCKIYSPINILFIDARIDRVQQKDLAMHGSGAPVSTVVGSAHPLEIADHFAADTWVDVMRLRQK